MRKQLLEMAPSLKKMIGKRVYVTLGDGWTGWVTDVVDETTLVVAGEPGKAPAMVNIFDIRSV